MTAAPERRETTLRYLLGTLTASDRERVESGFFGSPEALEELAVVEDELIDLYLGNALTAAEREQFEKAYLSSPDRARKIASAREFHQFLAAKRLEESRAGSASISVERMWRGKRLLAAAAAVAAMAVGSLLVMEFFRSRRELQGALRENAALKSREENLRAEVSRLRAEAEQSQAELTRERPKELRLAVASLLLGAGLEREEPLGRILEISPQTDLVRLTALIETEGYRSFQAVVQTADNREVWREASLKPRQTKSGRSVTFEVPASRLPSGDYIVVLRGVATVGKARTVGEYFFRLIKR